MKKIDVNALNYQVLKVINDVYFFKVLFIVEKEHKVFEYSLFIDKGKRTKEKHYIRHENFHCPYCEGTIFEVCKGFEPVIPEFYEQIQKHPKLRLKLLFKRGGEFGKN